MIHPARQLRGQAALEARDPNARLEEAVGLCRAILDRLPDYRIARPVSYGNFSLRGPSSAWIDFA